jgi:hypothetical protein
VIGLVYLVWLPLGLEPVREFVRSYQLNAAGSEHELWLVLNGSDPNPRGSEVREGIITSTTGAAERALQALRAELDPIDHRLIALEQPMQDLAAYGAAARRIEHPRLCLLNSYSVVLADGWLSRLASALDEPDVGLAGASASWESQAEWRRGQARHWLRHLSAIRVPRRDFPRFPNPHVRTTAFAIDRAVLLEMGLERASDKYAAYLLESGRVSITRQVHERGLRTVVVGRDGRVYDVEEWPRSATYRSGGQKNLLVADNRTREWESASPRVRRRLTRDAWGRAS